MTDPHGALPSIRLLLPAQGSRTAPLQKTPWPGWKAVEKARERRSGDWWSDGPEHDRSLPRPVTLRWECLWQGKAVPLTYAVRLSAMDGSGEEWVIGDLPGEQAQVVNLRIATTYQWQVAAYTAGDDGGAPLAISPAGTFHTHPAPPRWIAVPGVTNVRDLGGWPLEGGGRVRQGLFFRGSEMNAHCTITEAGAAVLLDRLGIRSDVDLRGEGEDWRPVLDARRVDYYHFPLASYDMIASMKHIPMYRDLFALLADPSKYPIYLHC